MITVDEYENFDAVGLATLIADKEVSALEVVESAIARIESRNSALNAVIATLFDCLEVRCLVCLTSSKT